MKSGSFSDNVLAVFANDPFKSYNYKQVAAAMGVTDKASRSMVLSIMSDLARQGVILEDKKGKFRLNPSELQRLAPKSNYVTGTVDMKQTGKAYVITEETGEDIYISSANTGRALHGDKVKVFLFPRRPGRKLEGQIVEVLQRAKNTFVGTLQLSAKYAFFIPDNSSVAVDFFIPKENIGGAKNGEKVVVELTEWPEHARNPFGKVVKVLGKPGEHKVEMQSILVEFDFPLSFPKKQRRKQLPFRKKYLLRRLSHGAIFERFLPLLSTPKMPKISTMPFLYKSWIMATGRWVST